MSPAFSRSGSKHPTWRRTARSAGARSSRSPWAPSRATPRQTRSAKTTCLATKAIASPTPSRTPRATANTFQNSPSCCQASKTPVRIVYLQRAQGLSRPAAISHWRDKRRRGDRRPKKAAGHTLQHNSDEDQRQARPKCEYQGTDDHNARPDCAITARLERTLSNTSPPGSWLSNAATLAISLGFGRSCGPSRATRPKSTRIGNALGQVLASQCDAVEEAKRRHDLVERRPSNALRHQVKLVGTNLLEAETIRDCRKCRLNFLMLWI